MAKIKAAKIISKKHLARQERERRQTLAITYSAIAIIVIVVGLIGYSILYQNYLQYQTPVAKVGEDTITTREFQMRVRLARQQYINQYFQYIQYAQMFGIQDPTTDSYFGPYLNQIQTSLDNFTQLGSDTLDEIINEVLIRQYAKNNGITVSAEEVSSAVQSEMGYFPNGTQTPTITPTSIIYPTLSSTELALVTLTPIPTPYPTLTPQPTPTLDLAATPTTIPTITPTATPYTQEGFKNAYATVVASYSKLSMNDADIRKVFFENRLYRERVYTVITKDVPHEQDQAWARHILVADEATAKNVINQLFNGGDWQTLAAKYSTDSGSKDNGGDVGWFGKGKMVAEFENAAFTLPVGTISAPVKTTYGYHIIQVLGHEFRPLSESEYKSLTDAKFQEWLKAQRDAATVDISEDYLTKIPTEPTLASATGQ